MSAFCGGNGSIPSMTTQEMKALYSPPSGVGLLPNPLPPLNNDGFVDDNWLYQYLQRLQSSGVLPTPPPLKDVASAPGGSPDSQEPIARYTSDMKTIISNIKTEYCFYEAQYFAAVDMFLQSISDASVYSKGADSIQNHLELARMTNQRVIVYTQVVNTLSKYNYKQTQNWNSDINNLNSQFGKNAAGLKEQADVLNKSTAAADLNKRMISYTVEKNRANTNLLSLYTILNASAIAILIYISRS